MSIISLAVYLRTAVKENVHVITIVHQYLTIVDRQVFKHTG